MTTAMAVLKAGSMQCSRVSLQGEARFGRFAISGRDCGERVRCCSVLARSRIRASSRHEVSSPMELWPGVSSPAEFEFGYQKPHTEEKAPDSCDIEGIAVFDSSVQPYMCDVDMLEEKELAAEYVPPPPIPLEDVEMRIKGEEVMYTLLKYLPGSMKTLLHDHEKWDALVKIFSEKVEFQDPLICSKGIHSFERLLEVLCHSGIVVNLHDIYYENIAGDRFKRCVYAVWTATLTSNLEESLEELKLTDWWETAYGSLVDHLGESQHGLRSTHQEYELPDKTLDVDRNKPLVMKSARHRALQLSGESKLEVNKGGEVTSISSRWCKLTTDDDLELVTSKLWLAGLYSRNGL